MSLPITQCLMVRACTDEQAYKVLLERMTVNIKHGAYTEHACTHDPHCFTKVTPEQAEALEARLIRDMAETVS